MLFFLRNSLIHRSDTSKPQILRISRLIHSSPDQTSCISRLPQFTSSHLVNPNPKHFCVRHSGTIQCLAPTALAQLPSTSGLTQSWSRATTRSQFGAQNRGDPLNLCLYPFLSTPLTPCQFLFGGGKFKLVYSQCLSCYVLAIISNLQALKVFCFLKLFSKFRPDGLPLQYASVLFHIDLISNEPSHPVSRLCCHESENPHRCAECSVHSRRTSSLPLRTLGTVFAPIPSHQSGELVVAVSMSTDLRNC